MNDQTADQPGQTLSKAEELSALFANLVLQQSNMAMFLLGKVASPQTGETVKDLDAAKLFIDQMEMLETKTKGNLTKEEHGLLAGNLMALRMAYVEAVESGPKPGSPPPKPAAVETPPAAAAAAQDEESRKKFSKKY